MIKGISFEIPNGYKQIFKELLYDVDIERYYWFNIDSQDQVFLLNGNKEFLFDQSYYTGSDFKKIINTNDYYAVFTQLQAYTKNEYQEIRTYSDFLNSNCEILILIDDCIFVEVYSKNIGVINLIKNNANKNGFSKINNITNENDIRKEIRSI